MVTFFLNLLNLDDSPRGGGQMGQILTGFSKKKASHWFLGEWKCRGGVSKIFMVWINSTARASGSVSLLQGTANDHLDRGTGGAVFPRSVAVHVFPRSQPTARCLHRKTLSLSASRRAGARSVALPGRCEV